MQAISQTHGGRRVVRLAAAAFALASVLLSGCSQSTPPAASQGPAAGGGVGAPQSASSIQSNMDKVKADPHMSDAQKKLMLDQMQHAMNKVASGN